MSPEDTARHRQNLADLMAARDVMKAQWAADDAARDAERAETMASFDRGIADFTAATGLEPEPAPEVEPAV